MSKQSTVQRVIAALEAERADLLAKAATFEHAINKLKAQTPAKPKLVRKPKTERIDGSPTSINRRDAQRTKEQEPA